LADAETEVFAESWGRGVTREALGVGRKEEEFDRRAEAMIV
jgi:hypothetical protein